MKIYNIYKFEQHGTDRWTDRKIWSPKSSVK